MPETTPIANHKLRHERERRAWSQLELADMVGTTPINVGRWERGVTSPGPYYRQKLCEVFEKSLEELGLVSEKIDIAPAADVPSSNSPISPTQEVPTTYWNIPYNRNLLFTGRDDILVQLHDAFLNGEQPIALAQPQAISGLGGIGKTQTAVEYAYRYRDGYDAVFWARADSTDLLTSDYLLIATLLNLPQRTEQDQNLVVKAVIHWFDTHEGWLLILDNADQFELIDEFIPSAGKGRVLLTTRANSTGTMAQRIEIEKMSLGEGMLFLLRRMKRLKGSAGLESIPENMRQQAHDIVEIVDGLPLALDQVGAYIEETGCSLSDYLKFYKTRRNRLLRTRGRDSTGHPEPVATTWSLSFEKAERANPAAAELLRLCAFLHPDEIPEAMIVEGASELGPILQPVSEDELELNEAIRELRKYSLVKRDPEEKLLNIHRLVQAVLRDTMDKEIQREWAERVVRVVSRTFPDPENIAIWPTCQRYMPHAQICSMLIGQREMTFPAATQLLHRAGNYLLARARYREAEPILKQALAIREATLGLEHPDVATSIDRLASLYHSLGQYSQAESYYQQALALRQSFLGSEHPDVAISLNHLAELYYEYGQYSQAGQIFEQALEVHERVLGPDHPEVAQELNNVALVYIEQSKYDQAESLFQRAIAINEQSFRPDEVAINLNNMAYLYYIQGKYSQAEAFYQRAIAIDEQTRGPGHPGIAGTLNNLAELYCLQGKYAQAGPLLQRALAIREQSLGHDHPHMAISLNSLGVFYRDQGKYTQAEPLLQQALTIRERNLNPDHPELSESLNNLGVLYDAQRKYLEAESLFRRALAIREHALGPEHPGVAQTLHDLAQLYAHEGLYSQAEQFYQRALRIRQTLEPEHPDVATTLENYAQLLLKTGRESEAEAVEADAQAIRILNRTVARTNSHSSK